MAMTVVSVLSLIVSLSALAAFFVGGIVLTILAGLDAEVRSGALVPEIQPQPGGVRRAAGRLRLASSADPVDP